MRIIYFLLFIILLCPLFSYQFNSDKFVLDYDFIIPSRTEQQLEEKIRKMKEIVPEKELQEKITASILSDNEPIISQKKLICEGKIAIYKTMRDHSLKMGEYEVFFDYDKEKHLTQSYIFDKPFIVIKDSIQLNWTYFDETKQIGAFKAKKAIAKKDTTFFAEVWYTEDLPAFPIEDLFGVKGGVVEATFAKGEKLKLTNFSTTLSKDDVIKKPSKGKTLTEKEFEELKKQKIDEVNEHARNSRKN